MAKTIHTLAYMVTADTRSFKEGLVLTRNELKATKDIVESTRSPIKQFGSEVSALGDLHRKGAISGGQYVSSLNQLIAGHTAGIPIIGRFTSILSLGNPLMIAGTVAAGGLAVGITAIAGAAAVAAVNIRDQISKIDDLIASASTIGIAVDSFQALSHAAALADIDIGAMSKGIESMLSAVSKGADGSKKLEQAFAIIGLNAKDLMALSPEEQLKQITQALDGLTNQADRVRVATQIFGNADFLRLDASQIERATQLMGELGGGLSALDVETFGVFDGAVQDFNLSLDVSWKKLTMAVLPALTSIAEAATEFLVSLNQSEGFQNALDTITATLQVGVEVAKEMYLILESWLSPIFQFLDAITGASAALAFVGDVTGISGDISAKRDANAAARETSAKEAADRQREANAIKQEARKYLDEQKSAEDEAAKAAKAHADELERVADAEKKIVEAGQSLVDGLKDEIATFGMSSREAKIYDAAKQGVALNDILQASALDKHLNAMERFKKLQDVVKSALESAKSPTEKFTETIEDYREALGRGIINQAQFDKLLGKEVASLPTAARPAGVNPMMQGSSAAETFLAEAKARQQGQRDRSQEIIDILDSIDKRLADEKGITMPTTVPKLGAA